MNILPFHLNIPAEVTLEQPEGTLVQGRYGDRVMYTLADGKVMYVPPFVAEKIRAAGITSGERFELCKVQTRQGGRRSIEWTVRRLDGSAQEPETPLERDLRHSIEAISVKGDNGNRDKQDPPNPAPASTTKLEYALRTAISAAHNAERYGAELG